MRTLLTTVTTVAALLLSSSITTAASAEPFLLSEPRAVAGPALNDVSIGGGPRGFLIAGTASHEPVAVLVDTDGNAQIGLRSVAGGNASSVGEPLFDGDRWVVTIAPDFLNPERLLIAEIGEDGSLLREPRSFVFPRRAHAEIARGANGFLSVVTRVEGVNRYALTARTLSADLEILGNEHVLPGSLVFPGSAPRMFRVVREGDGYAVAYATETGLVVARLASDGSLIGAPAVVATASRVVVPDLVVVEGGLIVVWAEGDDAGRWTLRAAKVSSGVDSTTLLGTVEGIHAPALYLRHLGGDLVAIYQGITDGGGRRAGGEIVRQNVDANGALAGERSEVPGLRGSDVLVGAASSGDELLIVWERHIAGVGISLTGTIVPSPATATSKPVRLSYAGPKALAMSATVDGVTTAAWVEHSAVGETLWVGRYDREGRRLALRDVRFIEGIFGSLDIAVGGGTALLVWQEGQAVFGAFLNDDTSFRGESFVIATPPQFSVLSPRATWDGSRFVVVWTPLYDLAAAFVSASGMQQDLGIIASFPPFNTPSFRFIAPSVAANQNGVVVAVYAQESNACFPLFPCPEQKSQLAFIRFDASGNPARIDMRPVDSDPMPDITTDGRDFVAIWKTANDIRTRLISGPLGSSTERVLTAFRSAFSPKIAWSGSEYVAGWGYQTGDAVNIAAVMLERTAHASGMVRARTSSGEFAALAAFSGDALLGSFGGITAPRRSEAVFGEFLRDLEVLASRRRSVSPR